MSRICVGFSSSRKKCFMKLFHATSLLRDSFIKFGVLRKTNLVQFKDITFALGEAR